MITTFRSTCGECRSEITTRCRRGNPLGWRWHMLKLLVHLMVRRHEDQPTLGQALRELWRLR